MNKIEFKKFSSVWDALEDAPSERERLKKVCDLVSMHPEWPPEKIKKLLNNKIK